MGCPHCLQCSSAKPQHMIDATFAAALRFIDASHSRAVVFSGGEPTLHPKWRDYLEATAKIGTQVLVATNGWWMADSEAVRDDMLDVLAAHRNVNLQVTCLRNLYKDHDAIAAARPAFAKMLKERGLKHRMSFVDGDETAIVSMKALGRALSHPRSRELAGRNTVSTTSCFPYALAARQVGYVEAIQQLEMRGKFCHPLIDWCGNVHWSESWLCPSFGNVTDDFEKIAKGAVEFKPCGKCPDYAKLVAKNEPKYVLGKMLLGVTPSAVVGKAGGGLAKNIISAVKDAVVSGLPCVKQTDVGVYRVECDGNRKEN